MRYLTLSNFADDPDSDGNDAKLRFSYNPFFYYAALRWADHVRRSSAPVVTDLVLELLNRPGNLANTFHGMSTFPSMRAWYAYYTSSVLSALHVAAMLGLVNIAAALLASGVSADERDSCHYTPLLLASEMGHEAMVELLLDRDDVNAEAQLTSPWLHTAVTLAAYSGHDAVVRALLRHGANKSSYNTALDYAVNQRRCAVVETLLEAGGLIRFSTLKAAIGYPRELAQPHQIGRKVSYSEAQTRLMLDLLKRYGADFDHGLDLFKVAIAEGTSYTWLRDQGFAPECFKDGEARGNLLYEICAHAGIVGWCPHDMFD